MGNKDKIAALLADVDELERLIAERKEADAYPASFFERTFHLAHKIVIELHALEELQVEALRKQMEEHRRLIESMPLGDTPVPEAALPREEAPAKMAEPVPLPRVEEERKAEEKEDTPPAPVTIAEKPGRSLNDILEKKNLADFRKAFSLNDRFRFRRELFKGDEEAMNEAIEALNRIPSYEESVAYLSDVLKWDLEDAPVADFIKLLEKRFS